MGHDKERSDQPRQYRVLFVENDPKKRDEYFDLLTEWGYAVFGAEGEGDQLIEDAKIKAKQHRCHLAIVDMRLRDDTDRNDLSGLELAPQLLPAITITWSAWGDRATVREAIRQKKVFDFVGKEEGPVRLQQAIADAIQRNYPYQPDFFGLPFNYQSKDIVRRLRLPDPTVPDDEPLTVLSQLYANDNQVSKVWLTSLAGSYGSSVGAAVLERSVVLLADAKSDRVPGFQRREIVKFGWAQHVQDEIDNYENFVRNYLTPKSSARIEDPTKQVVWWDIGAIRYTDVEDGGAKPFRWWYEQNNTPQVIQVFKNLFDETLKPWYSKWSHADWDYNFVFQYFAKDFPKLYDRIMRHKPRTTSLPGVSPKLLDPIGWTKINAPKSQFKSNWKGLIHGDLHTENVFVDEVGKTRVIDYERSGFGYVLRDFVEMEADIRLRLLPLPADRYDLAYHFDLLLLSQNVPTQLPAWKDIPGADEKTGIELRKAFEAICKIREWANQLAHFEKMEEYYWALLMETLFSVLRTYDELEPAARTFPKRRARLAAALIAERLNRWRGEWPPKEWTILPTEIPARMKSPRSRKTPDHKSPVQFADGYALVIGVGHTPNDSTWSLPTTTEDAKQVHRALINPQMCGYKKDYVRLLHDESASLQNIKEALAWLSAQTRKNREATAVIYFSGHGLQDEDGRYALLPSDVNPDDLKNTPLWGDELTEALRRIEARRLLVLIDACHAGGMTTAKGEPVRLPAGFTKAPPPPALLAQLKQGEGRAVINSCRENQESWILRDGSLSIFTFHLLEALRGAANLPNETTVRVSNLINHLGKKVQETARSQYQVEQVPWTDQASEDFPVALLMGGKGLSKGDGVASRSRYNLSAIRNLLTDAFNEEELVALCHDHFPDVHRNVAGRMTFASKVEELLDYSERHMELDALLQYVREQNARQFNRYEDEIYVR